MVSGSFLKILRGCGVVLGTAAAIGLFLSGGYAVEAVVGAARSATGGGLTAMAVTGWLFSLIPFALFWAGMRLKNHARTRTAAVLCFGLTAPLALIYGSCWPVGYNSTLAEAVSGPGGGAFVAGFRNGLLAGFLVSVAAPVVIFNEKLRARFGDLLLRRLVTASTVMLLVVTLASGIVLAP